MIEIIKQGTIQWYHKTCPKCGTIFKYTKDETHVDCNRSTTFYPPLAINCPLCGTEISLNNIL